MCIGSMANLTGSAQHACVLSVLLESGVKRCQKHGESLSTWKSGGLLVSSQLESKQGS